MIERRKYRHLFSTICGILLLGILTLWFAVTWDRNYADVIIAPFFRRGNWVVVLIYTFLTAIVYKAYHCTRFGYLKRSDLIYYQLIGTAIVNFITYFQISVIGRRFLAVAPILRMTLVDFITIVSAAFLVSRLYFRLYPPRRLVVVYGSH
ncbi:MAG: sugar transferase, partial [Oscillospiraceae bacterium]|nr:sugar transferase [Oscillospiraceae bacterium]